MTQTVNIISDTARNVGYCDLLEDNHGNIVTFTGQILAKDWYLLATRYSNNRTLIIKRELNSKIITDTLLKVNLLQDFIVWLLEMENYHSYQGFSHFQGDCRYQGDDYSWRKLLINPSYMTEELNKIISNYHLKFEKPVSIIEPNTLLLV